MAIRVGVVGIGFMGKTHLGIWLKDKRAQVTAFCDIDPKKLAGDWGGGGGNIGSGAGPGIDPHSLHAHDNIESLCADPDVDLIDVCVPTPAHAACVQAALKAGKHVLCEKPLTIDLKQARALAGQARRAKGLSMPAHCIRFWPEWAWLKDAVASKRYGRALTAVFKRYGSTPLWSSQNWLMQAPLSGGALFDMHIHDADFIRYVFGEPQAVFAVGNGGKAVKNGIDHVVASYLYRDPRLVVSAEGGWDADPTYGFTMRYTVVFEKATADYDLAREGRTLLVHAAGAKDPEVVKTSPNTGWDEEIFYFLDCVEQGKRPAVTSFADSVKSVALVHAELKSIKTRRVVKL